MIISQKGVKPIIFLKYLLVGNRSKGIQHIAQHPEYIYVYCYCPLRKKRRNIGLSKEQHNV